MDFPNFPYTGLDNVSFLKSSQVQEYIEKFTEHFELNKHIQVRIKGCTYTLFNIPTKINVYKSKWYAFIPI